MSTLYYIVIGTASDIASYRHSAPLEHVAVTGFIRDSVAEYTLVQTYVNPLKDATIEAAYTFPLYEGVAVSGFEAEIDGRKIVGRVQEKIAATKEYEEAVKEGKVASLLEQERPDVFQASVGNIPPGKTISIRLTLVSEIKQDADENQVRFVLPTTIAPRYGAAPEVTSTSGSGKSKLSVDISCAMAKQITSVQSPSHTIQIHLGTTASEGVVASPTRVSLTADSLLDRDLVVIVQAVGLDAPRALAERHPRDGTIAVSLTFSPRFALNPIKSSELIFLVDRSGSMQGSQIEQAGEALELFLRSIPSDDHYINVIGFGSTHKALFPKSVPYSADSLKSSTKYAQAMNADMGGTEMTSAFQEVFQRRRREVPTQVFLLTDGEIWDVDTLVQCIKDAVEEGEKTNSFVRVFSLGVGGSVSHHLIESVARAGGGYAQLVTHNERMEKKVVNMLKAALMPPVTNVAVQWTSEEAPPEDEEDFEMVEAVADPIPVADPKDTTIAEKPINLFSTATEIPAPPSPPPSLPPPDVITPIQQAPFKIPALYRGARFTIYAILSPKTPPPKELILRGTTSDGPVELKAPVESVPEGGTMLHRLAARALVRDLEESASCIHALGTATATNKQMLKSLGVHVLQSGKKYTSLPLTDKLVADISKQKILELALKYNLSSKYTSWIAIDTESSQTIVRHESAAPVVIDSVGRWGGLRHGSRKMDAPQAFVAPMFAGSSVGMPRRRKMVVPHRQNNDPAWDLLSSHSSPPPPAPKAAGMGSIFNHFGGAQQQMQQQMQQMQQQMQLQIRQQASFVPSPRKSSPAPSSSPSSPPDPHAKLRSILRHQHFDGLFPLIPEIVALFSIPVEEMEAKLVQFRRDRASQPLVSETDWESVWATCLVVEFLRKQMPDLEEEWELVVEKAQKRVAAVVGGGKELAALQVAASELVTAGGL